MRQNLILAGVTSLVCLVLVTLTGEIYVRNFSKWGHTTPESLRNRGFFYEPSVFTQSVLAREEKTINLESIKGTSYHINRHGYRGEDFEFEKPDGVLRIMICGGSSTFDTRLSDPDDWPHRVQKILRERGFDNVEVINAGVPGHTSFDSFGKLFSEGHLMKPDIVVMYNGWNDIKHFHKTDPYLRTIRTFVANRDPRFYYQSGIDQWLSERLQLYVRLRQRYYEWRLGDVREGKDFPQGERLSGPGPVGLAQYTIDAEMFVRVAQFMEAVPVLVTQARLATFESTDEARAMIDYRYNLLTHDGLVRAYAATDSILRVVAERTGAVLLDGSTPITGKIEYFVDHVHLKPEGSRLLAEIVARKLEPIVAAVDSSLSAR